MTPEFQAYLIGGLAVAVCLGAGWLMGRRGLAALQREQQATASRLARAEAQTREQTRLVAHMRTERSTVANLALALPLVVRELNRHDLDRRRVPALILRVAEAIFQPGQALFYIACPGEDGTTTELRLVAHHGLTEVPESLERVRAGEGKLGWIVEKRVEMLKEDWLNPTRTENRTVPDNHPALKADIMGPLIGPAVTPPYDRADAVHGVLCLGALGDRPRDEKLMFQLVTNLAALALINADIRAMLRKQANHDGLTGLLNKRYFLQELGPLIYRAGREASALTLFIFDIDHFKNYNDTNGHPAGDELLKEISALLSKSVRPRDLCCRYGGEEFVVAMPGTDGETGLKVADRIRRAIEDHEFAHQQHQPGGNLTISGGVAEFPHDGNEGAGLVRKADEALYDSKRAGRNRVTRYRGVEIGDAADEHDRSADAVGESS